MMTSGPAERVFVDASATNGYSMVVQAFWTVWKNAMGEFPYVAQAHLVALLC
jgi:hypothetical protein